MLIAATALARLRDRNGFSLVEVLVAMLTGVVVIAALFAILEVSVRQSSHLSNVAQATQLSRTTMTRIVDPLHSACLFEGAAPVREKSTPTKLIFLNGYDESSSGKEPPAELPTAGIHKDVIEYSEATQTLKDIRYTSATKVPVEGEYTWLAATKTTQLGEKVLPVEGSTEIFKYFAYAEKPSTATNVAASALNETSVIKTGGELTKTQAGTIAAVQISFRMQSNERKEFKLSTSAEKGTFAEQSTLNIFSFMSPDSETTLTAKPCE